MNEAGVDLPLCGQYGEDRVDRPCCEGLRPLPQLFATEIDLRDVGTISRGTCASFERGGFFGRAVELPNDHAAYPLRILLPALEGADPACAFCPDTDNGTATAFGIGLEVPPPNQVWGFNSGRVVAIRVPRPWYFVSGGCGETCPWPCLGGYQEYGIRSCVTLSYGDFGFATADPNAPSVEAVIDVLPMDDAHSWALEQGQCCLFSEP